MHALLDPTNDYVFKRLFAEAPALLVSLINDLRPDLPTIARVEVLNPTITPDELSGKHIILDVLARDGQGDCYNVEIQVRRYGAWHQRGLYYLARTLGTQLNSGEDYQALRAAVGIHLLDFDLFTETAEERQQAQWRFEMRDEKQPHITLGNLLQLNLIELTKADRLGLSASPLRDWITFFKHWREDSIMTKITHEPVQQAMNRIRELSADDEARRLAFVRERALHDEVSFLNEARREGLQEGLQKGRQEGEEIGLQKGEEIGLQKGEEIGLQKGQRLTALNLLKLGVLTNEQIAQSTGLSVAEVEKLRLEQPH